MTTLLKVGDLAEVIQQTKQRSRMMLLNLMCFTVHRNAFFFPPTEKLRRINHLSDLNLHKLVEDAK